MKLRCELHLDHEVSRVILAPRPEEKLDHLVLKLAACAMFHLLKPIVGPSAAHPSFGNLDVRPDLVALDEGGAISHWIECGNVSINKIEKAARRLPGARVIVVQSGPREAQQLRDRLQKEVKQADRIEIWAFPEGTFAHWIEAIQENRVVRRGP